MGDVGVSPVESRPGAISADTVVVGDELRDGGDVAEIRGERHPRAGSDQIKSRGELGRRVAIQPAFGTTSKSRSRGAEQGLWALGRSAE